MEATTKIKNPEAPATDRQIELVRALAHQFEAYGDAEVEHIVKTHAATKGDASTCIENLMAAGAVKPAKPKPAKAKRPSSKATDKQVAYALGLIDRIVRYGGWFDSYLGQFHPTPPSETEVRRMSGRQVSALIEDLKHDV